MRRAPFAAATLALAFASGPPLVAQGTFRLVVESVVESRERTASNDTTGRLSLVPKLEGEALAEAKAFRIRVKAAVDDTGRDLLADESEPSPWEENASGESLWIHLSSPARAATSVTVSGTVDLWMPKRDARHATPTRKSTVSVPFELKDVPLP